jgi:hypothetical protein
LSLHHIESCSLSVCYFVRLCAPSSTLPHTNTHTHSLTHTTITQLQHHTNRSIHRDRACVRRVTRNVHCQVAVSVPKETICSGNPGTNQQTQECDRKSHPGREREKAEALVVSLDKVCEYHRKVRLSVRLSESKRESATGKLSESSCVRGRKHNDKDCDTAKKPTHIHTYIYK